jgi:hypothetical protein
MSKFYFYTFSLLDYTLFVWCCQFAWYMFGMCIYIYIHIIHIKLFFPCWFMVLMSPNLHFVQNWAWLLATWFPGTRSNQQRGRFNHNERARLGLGLAFEVTDSMSGSSNENLGDPKWFVSPVWQQVKGQWAEKGNWFCSAVGPLIMLQSSLATRREKVARGITGA